MIRLMIVFVINANPLFQKVVNIAINATSL